MNAYALGLIADAHRADLLRAGSAYRRTAIRPARRAPKPRATRSALPTARLTAPCPTC